MTDTKIMKAKFWTDVYLATIKELGIMSAGAAQIKADEAVEQLEFRIGASND